MPDPIVKKWKQYGHVYLWKYTERNKNFPGLHCSADRDGCASLLQLFDLTLPVTATVMLTPPPRRVLAVPRGDDARWRTFQSLKIKYAQPGFSEDLWELTITETQAELHLGTAKLAELQQGIRDIGTVNNDYSIGGVSRRTTTNTAQHSYNLWFW